MESQGFKDLIAYKKAYATAMEIFHLSQKFPREELYSLTDQVRRSSRAVCAIMAEGYRKRAYPKTFIARLYDADGECAETMVHLDFSMDCGYLSAEKHQQIQAQYLEVGKLLGTMINNPQRFGAASWVVKAKKNNDLKNGSKNSY